MRRLRIAAVFFVAAGAPAMRMSAVQQVRDAAIQPATGTASLAGVVVDDQETPKPIRRAVVTLTGTGLHPNRGAITDDEGRFTLRDLPAGRFTLAAERGGFITSLYGAKRPGRTGTEIAISDGQQIVDLRVRLWRGAVLSGVVRDESGEPVANTPVAGMPTREVTPSTLTLSNGRQATTNDLGEFRIFGLEPGTYVVRAGSAEVGRAQLAASEAEIDATLAALAARRQPAAMPRSAIRVEPPPTTVSTAPIYFPGTPVAADAAPIALQAGEERTGLDFAVHRIRIATIRGTILGPDGGPVSGAFVQLAADVGPVQFAGTAPTPVTISTGPDGTFRLSPISPGHYVLLARGAVVSASGRVGGPVPGSSWWVAVPVSVSGEDVDLATLTLQPGMTFSGRVVFDRAGTTPPPDPTSLRVEMRAESLEVESAQRRGRGGATSLRFLQPAIVRADGTFAATDLVPENYRLAVTGLENARWWLRAAISNGRDLLDVPLRLAPGEHIRDVTLVLTDRRSELSGTLTTPTGTAVSDLFVLAFPADAALRSPRSRRVQAVRPDNRGRFVLDNLPAGEYLICPLTDVDDGQWNDPGFLEPLVVRSVKITLGDGEKKVQDLRLTGG